MFLRAIYWVASYRCKVKWIPSFPASNSLSTWEKETQKQLPRILDVSEIRVGLTQCPSRGTANSKKNMVGVSHLCSKLSSGAYMGMCCFFLLFGFFNLMNNSESQPGHWATERSFYALFCVKCCLHFSFVASGSKILVIGNRGEKSLLKSRIVNMAPFFLLPPLPFLILKTFQTRVHSSWRRVRPTLNLSRSFWYGWFSASLNPSRIAVRTSKQVLCRGNLPTKETWLNPSSPVEYWQLKHPTRQPTRRATGKLLRQNV